MGQVLYIIRGLPGSGKTTLAKVIAQSVDAFGAAHIETDQFFETLDGGWVFDQSRIAEAHDNCFRCVVEALDWGNSVIVSNTATQKWEAQRYLDAAASRGVDVQIITLQGPWATVHGVPEGVIQQMAERFEDSGSWLVP